ncbi:MAG TPA: hypothetical protein VLQ65_13030 [Saliniramus sp.]|nr:hypothetical protein [Saliniramus sp.]
MDTLYHILGILSLLYVAATAVLGVVAFVDWLRRPPEASEEDVRIAVERYRNAYGDEVQNVLGNHIHGARLARAYRHKRMLCRVADKIREEDGAVPLRWKQRDQ